MSEQFNQQLKQQFDSNINPLRKGVPPQRLIIQGVVTLAIGLFAIFVPNTFTDLLGAIIGAYLILTSFLNIRGELRVAGTGGVVQPFRLVRSGIGLVTGAVTIVQLFVTTIDRPGAFTVLVIGLVLYSIAGLIGIFARKQGFPIGEILATALPLVFAALITYSLITGESIISIVSILLLVIGVVLIGYGFFMNRRATSAMVPPPPAAPPPASAA